MTEPSVDDTISVLLPVKNAEAWLEKACLSVLDNQASIEVLIVDDGSSDASLTIARRLCHEHAAVRQAENPGQGIVSALNHGASLAKGRLIARMDGDDLSLPGRLDKQLRSWRRAGAKYDRVVACSVEPFSDDKPVGEGMRRYCRWLNSLTSPQDHYRQRLVESPVCHPTILMTATLLGEVGGYRQGPYPEDYDLWLRLMKRGVSFSKLSEVLYRWRDHPQRLTRIDPRYHHDAFMRRKFEHLKETWLRPNGITEVQVCGAGKDAKRWCDLLVSAGVAITRAFDVHPGRIGQSIRGTIPVVSHEVLANVDRLPTLVAIGREGGRQQVRDELLDLGWTEAVDFLCLQ